MTLGDCKGSVWLLWIYGSGLSAVGLALPQADMECNRASCRSLSSRKGHMRFWSRVGY